MLQMKLQTHMLILTTKKLTTVLHEVRRDDFSLINCSSRLIDLEEELMFLSDHGKFSIINPKLINPNKEINPSIIQQ